MTAYSNDIEFEQLLQLSQEVTRIASNLAKLSMGAAPQFGADQAKLISPVQDETEVMQEAVSWLIAARLKRARYLSNELFAEPAWDILLDSLRAELSGERVSVSSLCIAAAVPATTGLRWVGNMVRQGLLIRQPDPRDARRVFIELAPDVSVALRRYFAEVIQPGRVLA